MHHLLFITTFILATCGGGPATDLNVETAAEPSESQSEATVPSPDPLGEPCVLDVAKVAAALGWKSALDPEPNQLNSEKLQACDYIDANYKGRLTVSQERFEGRIVEGGYLSRSYQSTLEKTDSDLKWRSVESDLGDEAIYGHGKNGPNHTYTLQWRFGEHTQLILSLRGGEKRNQDETLEKLIQLAEQI